MYMGNSESKDSLLFSLFYKKYTRTNKVVPVLPLTKHHTMKMYGGMQL